MKTSVLRACLTLLVAGALTACGGAVAGSSGSSDGGSKQETGSSGSEAGQEDGGASRDAARTDSGDTDAGEAGVADVGQPDAPLPVPLHHRPNDSQCATERPPGTCPGGATGPGFECTSDSQCTDGGADGRCTNGPGGPAGCFCTYDECKTDDDCGTGKVCVCHDSAYAYGGNTCMPGDCRVDADCGPGGYCSPAHGTTGCGSTSGYYCHTRHDQCTNDSDCTGPGENACSWSAKDARWECVSSLICV